VFAWGGEDLPDWYEDGGQVLFSDLEEGEEGSDDKLL